MDTEQSPQVEEVEIASGTRSKNRKLKRFLYANHFDYHLVKCVRDKDVHAASNGKKGEIFEAVCELFLNETTGGVLITHERPSQKSVLDCIKRLEERRREKGRLKAGQYGITESLQTFENLLDDLILEKD